MSVDDRGRTGPKGLVRTIVTAWALLGGVLLAAVAAMNVAAILAAIVGLSIPGDFEMTEVGVAVAVFAFLPYCQLTRANVSADIFTTGASPRWIAFFSLLGSLAAIGFGALLMWRMYLGMLDQKAYGYTTAILQFPHWLAFLPILFSLLLLLVAALTTLAEDVKAGAAAS